MNSNELSLPMNISLDENITDTAIEHLAKYGHNVKSLRLAGISYSDDDVIKTVIKSNSVLITHNGKDFIDSIPPRKDILHYGLIWLERALTPRNSVEIGRASCRERVWNVVGQKRRERIRV